MILMLRVSFPVEVTVVSTVPRNIPRHALVGKTLLYTLPVVLFSRRCCSIVILGEILSSLYPLFTYLLFKRNSLDIFRIVFIYSSVDQVTYINLKPLLSPLTDSKRDHLKINAEELFSTHVGTIVEFHRSICETVLSLKTRIHRSNTLDIRDNWFSFVSRSR